MYVKYTSMLMIRVSDTDQSICRTSELVISDIVSDNICLHLRRSRIEILINFNSAQMHVLSANLWSLTASTTKDADPCDSKLVLFLVTHSWIDGSSCSDTEVYRALSSYPHCSRATLQKSRILSVLRLVNPTREFNALLKLSLCYYVGHLHHARIVKLIHSD